MRERRSEVRMLCADLVEVWWKDSAGKTKKSQSVLEDISASGACFQLEVPVPLGVVLRWRSEQKKFAGVVRYCVYREIGYFVGVQFEPSSRWSKTKYAPAHLLDLEKLIRQASKTGPKQPVDSVRKR
ncbi:MAG TPA: PilZ domain-containing protein [Bryobacteraceae bacterium]|nr:PilZ domain-containing protein [Bryobacteraceae bacterium]